MQHLKFEQVLPWLVFDTDIRSWKGLVLALRMQHCGLVSKQGLKGKHMPPPEDWEHWGSPLAAPPHHHITASKHPSTGSS